MAYVTTYTYLNCFLETTGQLFKNQQTLRIISSIFINTTFFKTRRKCFEMNKKMFKWKLKLSKKKTSSWKENLKSLQNKSLSEVVLDHLNCFVV